MGDADTLITQRDTLTRLAARDFHALILNLNQHEHEHEQELN
jgi:hypothetical protein